MSGLGPHGHYVPIVPAVVEITNWSQFGNTVSEMLGERNAADYVFRGQPDASFELESSFDRHFRSFPFRRKKEIELNLQHRFDEISNRSEVLPGSSSRPDAGLGQHYGLMTRLLDWTESRYVAAFFAFASLNQTYPASVDTEAEAERNVSIFALDVESAIIDEDYVELVAPGFGQSNERVRRQRGLFTRNRTDSDTLEQCVESFVKRNSDEFTRPPLIRFDVPVNQARVALRDLHQMRISYSELFPGLEGAAREAIIDEWLGDDVATGKVAQTRARSGPQ